MYRFNFSSIDSFFDFKTWCFTGGFTLLQIAWLKKFLFSDMEYLQWLFVVVAIDLITGLTKAWVNKEEITSKKLRDSVGKIIQYGAFLIITHVLTNFTFDGQKFDQVTWIGKMGFTFLILVEIKSVYENIIAINPRLDVISSISKKILAALKDVKFKEPDPKQ